MTDTFHKPTKNGVSWLNQQKHLLQEYNEVYKHTMPEAGNLVEY